MIVKAIIKEVKPKTSIHVSLIKFPPTFIDEVMASVLKYTSMEKEQAIRAKVAKTYVNVPYSIEKSKEVESSIGKLNHEKRYKARNKIYTKGGKPRKKCREVHIQMVLNTLLEE